MLAQGTLAQHSAKHVDHNFPQKIVMSFDGHSGHHDDHEDPQEHKKHECPECLLSQSLQTAFYNASDLIFIAPQAQVLEVVLQSHIFVEMRYRSHLPRAPPVFLI